MKGMIVGWDACVHQDGRDETIVLCLANKSEDGRKITMWRHLRAELPK